MMELRAEKISQDFLRYSAKDGYFIAVQETDFRLAAGTLTVVTGRSGSGKSTLLHILGGLMKPVTGRVLVDDVDLYTMGEDARTRLRSRHIGIVPQRLMSLAALTVRENILLGAQIKGEWSTERVSAFDELVADLGLSDLLERYPRELSGGQQQRVGLARVFLLAPDLLLMDEPFSALDAITRESMQEVFLSLWKKQAVTTLLVTHYVEEALTLAGRIAVMRGTPGRVAEIMDNPYAGDLAHRSSQAFFAMGQELRAKIEGGV